MSDPPAGQPRGRAVLQQLRDPAHTVVRYAKQIQHSVRSIGSDLHMDYTAVGQATHLAARMEQMANPGSVLIAPSTLRLAEGSIQVIPLGARVVEGLETAVHLSLGALDAQTGDGDGAGRRRALAQRILDEPNMRSAREPAEKEVMELGHLFIVARSQPDLDDFLSQDLSGAERIKVVLDRRRGEQRQRFDLRDWGFAVSSRRHG